MSRPSTEGDISRRDFLRVSGATAAAVSLAPTIITTAHASITRGAADVVLSRNPSAAPDIETVNFDLVQQVMDNGILSFTGKKTVGEAWKSLFPKLEVESKIGLKVNTVAGTRPKQLCTQLATVQAVVNGLAQMRVSGRLYPLENIIIWDRWNDELEGAGFTINSSGTGYRCFGTTSTMEEADPKIGYDGNAPWKSLEDSAYFTKIVSQLCDYQINLPVLKSMGRGITFAMKNMYGTFSTSFPQWGEIGTIFHREMAARMCDLHQTDLIHNKFVLHVGDALLGKAKAQGGPAGPADFAYGGLFFCKNPVTLDCIAATVIRAQDEEVTDAPWQKMAEERGLGLATPERINLIKV